MATIPVIQFVLVIPITSIFVGQKDKLGRFPSHSTALSCVGVPAEQTTKICDPQDADIKISGSARFRVIPDKRSEHLSHLREKQQNLLENPLIKHLLSFFLSQTPTTFNTIRAPLPNVLCFGAGNAVEYQMGTPLYSPPPPARRRQWGPMHLSRSIPAELRIFLRKSPTVTLSTELPDWEAPSCTLDVPTEPYDPLPADTFKVSAGRRS